MMHILVLQILCFLFSKVLAYSDSETETNSPVFNVDHTALEKNIAAIFNKVAHSSPTTKRSVPVHEAQVLQSAIAHSTSPSPAVALHTTSFMVFPMVIPRATNPPFFHELPSYAPPSRALFTPPLPPEYANPFADKPTLRGTNVDVHSNLRRPVPPPSLTPTHERIPIKPPDLIDDSSKIIGKYTTVKGRENGSIGKDSFEMSERQKSSNDTIDFIPSLHFTSISRILSGSNGKKQDIPEILLKPIPTKSSQNYLVAKSTNEESSTTILMVKSTDKIQQTSTYASIMTISNAKMNNQDYDNQYDNSEKNDERYHIRNTDIINGESLSYPQSQPPSIASKAPTFNSKIQNIITHSNEYTIESTLKIAWSLHAYLTATMFTLIALYSVYKIVRFDDTTNLLTQSYFLSIHLLLTIICTLRCFYLFYDAYNLNHSLPKTLSEVLEFLPFSLLTGAFATLILYMSRCSTIPSLYQNKFSSPLILAIAFITHITLCISLHISGYILNYSDESRILPLICQCIYIIICVILGLSYMYVYRVIRSQSNVNNSKSVNGHITDFTTSSLNIAIKTTIATALLFILMGFVHLYDIFGVQERLQRYSWRRWGWEFSVRLIELLMCGLLSWVASLTQFQLREKQIQQHAVHSGFALFPCGSSTSTENMDDSLYPAICSTNQAIQNYTIRTGKQVYDDSFPLNTLPDNLNTTGTFERRSIRNSGVMGHFPQEICSSFAQSRIDTQNFCKSDNPLKNIPQKMQSNSCASGSTMLVAEDGFVRFRNLGIEDSDISNPQSLIGLSNERRNSTACNDTFDIKQSTIDKHTVQNYQQLTVPYLHLDLHRNKQIIYNNT